MKLKWAAIGYDGSGSMDEHIMLILLLLFMYTFVANWTYFIDEHNSYLKKIWYNFIKIKANIPAKVITVQVKTIF